MRRGGEKGRDRKDRMGGEEVRGRPEGKEQGQRKR